jgi:ubiquinone/menaquinone biosynthesis C-methylase UbiE
MRRPEFIAKQSRCPTGLLGWLIGCIMEAETGAENDAVLERLDLMPTDRVLEVGFGPGRALERVAGMVTAGSVAGVEVSEEMLGMAARRCERFIRGGRVELRLGTAEKLPFESAFFDKVYSVHTLYFWERPAEVVVELRRVLKSNGLLVLCFRPSGDAGTEDFPSTVYRFYTDVEVTRLLREGGFDEIAVNESGTSRRLLIATARTR